MWRAYFSNGFRALNSPKCYEKKSLILLQSHSSQNRARVPPVYPISTILYIGWWRQQGVRVPLTIATHGNILFPHVRNAPRA